MNKKEKSKKNSEKKETKADYCELILQISAILFVCLSLPVFSFLGGADKAFVIGLPFSVGIATLWVNDSIDRWKRSQEKEKKSDD